MAGRGWSQAEDVFLAGRYGTGDIEGIAQALGRTSEAIKLRAHKMKMRRDYSVFRKGTRCDRLTNNTLESAYWAGFILADGHISNSRLVVVVAERDELHLTKLATLLNCNISRGKTKYNGGHVNHSRIAVRDVDNIPKFVEWMEVNPRKTYNPPNIRVFTKLSEDVLVGLLLGFIDGDGCIIRLKNRPDINIVIKCHKSWFDILEFFRRKLVDLSGQASAMKVRLVQDAKYAELRISNQKIIHYLIEQQNILQIPRLERKWSCCPNN